LIYLCNPSNHSDSWRLKNEWDQCQSKEKAPAKSQYWQQPVLMLIFGLDFSITYLVGVLLHLIIVMRWHGYNLWVSFEYSGIQSSLWHCLCSTLHLTSFVRHLPSSSSYLIFDHLTSYPVGCPYQIIFYIVLKYAHNFLKISFQFSPQ
jgi:hypothetical protein